MPKPVPVTGAAASAPSDPLVDVEASQVARPQPAAVVLGDLAGDFQIIEQILEAVDRALADQVQSGTAAKRDQHGADLQGPAAGHADRAERQHERDQAEQAREQAAARMGQHDRHRQQRRRERAPPAARKRGEQARRAPARPSADPPLRKVVTIRPSAHKRPIPA